MSEDQVPAPQSNPEGSDEPFAEPTRRGARGWLFTLIVVFVAAVAFLGGYATHGTWGDVVPGIAFPSEPEPQALAQNAAPASSRPSVGVDDDPWMGVADAPITIIEFSDFQCPYCKRFFDDTLQQLLAAYDGKIRFVYRDFPLSNIHPQAQKAAEAAQCAHEQGRYWAMHDTLFERQREWGNANAVAYFKAYAEGLGLDAQQFDACLDEGRYRNEVLLDLKAGADAGVTGTPGFFINGRALRGAVPFEYFEAVIEDELAKLAG